MDAAVLGFDNLPQVGNFTGTATESGFTLDFVDMFIDGLRFQPGRTVERRTNADGTLTVHRPDGLLFSFDAIDWQGERGAPSVSLEGFIGSTLVATDTFTSSSVSYTTFGASALSGAFIDRLVIRPERAHSNLGALDNLALTPVDSAVIGFDALALGPRMGQFEEDGFTLELVDMFVSSPSTSTPGNELERRANTDGTATLTRGDGTPFSFQSIDWQADSGTPSVRLDGFRNGALVGSDLFSTSASDYTTLVAQELLHATIDTLVISPERASFLGSGFANLGSLDTLRLALRQPSTAVSEPSALALASSSLLLLGALSRAI